MMPFEYAAPRAEDEVVSLLGTRWGETEILAGGTDLIGLMQAHVLTPRRLVNIKEIRGLADISGDSSEVAIGAVARLDDVRASELLEAFPAVGQAIDGIASMQLQAQGTFVGELLQRPRCWYFRGGHGLLAERGQRATEGDSRYHAIFANQGPAKFVSPSRLAPALIALGARVRVLGPSEEDQAVVPLEQLYQIPRDELQREFNLAPNQWVTHVLLDEPTAGRANCSATYEVRQGEGPDFPLAAAAAALELEQGRIARARVVLGQVAPVPWVAHGAAEMLVGQRVDPLLFRAVGEAVVRGACPLRDNAYKVQLARVAVERALLRAVGLPTGGFV